MEVWIVGLGAALAVTLAGAVGGLWGRYRARTRLARLVTSTPVRPIVEVEHGASVAAIQGTAQCEQPLVAPLSQRPAIGYQVVIEYQPPVGYDGRTEWVSVTLSRLREFQVVDPGGQATVRGSRCVLAIEPQPHSGEALAVALTSDELQRQLMEQGGSVTDVVAGRHLRVTERRLEPGATVYVLGRPQLEVAGGGAGGGYRQPPRHLVLDAPGEDAVLVADCTREELLPTLKRRLA